MTFVPNIPQSEIKNRISAHDALRRDHDEFAKKTNVKIQLLENENTIRKNETAALSSAHNDLVKEIGLIKEALEVCKKWMGATGTRLTLLDQKLDALLNAKVDLAAKITSAKKRLDDSEKA